MLLDYTYTLIHLTYTYTSVHGYLLISSQDFKSLQVSLPGPGPFIRSPARALGLFTFKFPTPQLVQLKIH